MPSVILLVIVSTSYDRRILVHRRALKCVPVAPHKATAAISPALHSVAPSTAPCCPSAPTHARTALSHGESEPLLGLLYQGSVLPQSPGSLWMSKTPPRLGEAGTAHGAHCLPTRTLASRSQDKQLQNHQRQQQKILVPSSHEGRREKKKKEKGEIRGLYIYGIVTSIE